MNVYKSVKPNRLEQHHLITLYTDHTTQVNVQSERSHLHLLLHSLPYLLMIIPVHSSSQMEAAVSLEAPPHSPIHVPVVGY